MKGLQAKDRMVGGVIIYGVYRGYHFHDCYNCDLYCISPEI